MKTTYIVLEVCVSLAAWYGQGSALPNASASTDNELGHLPGLRRWTTNLCKISIGDASHAEQINNPLMPFPWWNGHPLVHLQPLKQGHAVEEACPGGAL